MNLHRTEKQPDWEKVPEEERTRVQRIAAKTNGIVTPGNITSVAGAVLVSRGLSDIKKGKTKRGLAKIFVGRVFDLVDGTVADKTGTKSPTGEAVDAGLDKAVMFQAADVLQKRGFLPKHASRILLAQNVASAGLSLEAKARGVELHPSEEGKKGTAGQWMAVGLYSLATVARKSESPAVAEGLEAAALATLVAATTLTGTAIVDYNAQIRQPAHGEPGTPHAEHIA